MWKMGVESEKRYERLVGKWKMGLERERSGR